MYAAAWCGSGNDARAQKPNKTLGRGCDWAGCWKQAKGGGWSCHIAAHILRQTYISALCTMIVAGGECVAHTRLCNFVASWACELLWGMLHTFFPPSVQLLLGILVFIAFWRFYFLPFLFTHFGYFFVVAWDINSITTCSGIFLLQYPQIL